jgi:hypothetical protein
MRAGDIANREQRRCGKHHQGRARQLFLLHVVLLY